MSHLKDPLDEGRGSAQLRKIASLYWLRFEKLVIQKPNQIFKIPFQ